MPTNAPNKVAHFGIQPNAIFILRNPLRNPLDEIQKSYIADMPKNVPTKIALTYILTTSIASMETNAAGKTAPTDIHTETHEL